MRSASTCRGRATSGQHPGPKASPATHESRVGGGSDFTVTDLVQPLVGRDRELEVLGRLLAQARAGSQRFVFVTGEPGIGKSRLLRELLRDAEDSGALA